MTRTPHLTRLADELSGAERLAVLAVGSELLGDDAVGMLVGGMLAEHESPALRVFFGSTAPENVTGPIREFVPSHLLVVDAAELGAEPGTIELLDPAELAGVGFTTHCLPLSVVVSYLLRSLPDCRVLAVGIQPESLRFGAEPTVRVKAAATRLVETVRSVVLARPNRAW